MDPATNKREQRGPWGPIDRPVYHYPFGDYLYRSVSGYGQDGGSSMTSDAWSFITTLAFGFVAGAYFDRVVMRGRP
jgi:hypothetical protein